MSLSLDDRIDAVFVIDPSGESHIYGHANELYPWASVTKILSTLVIADVVSSGFATFDDEIEHPKFTNGSVTLKDLLGHASGLSSDSTRYIEPRTKRIYTNEAFEIAEEHISQKVYDEVGVTNIRELFNDGLRAHLDSKIEMRGSCATSAFGSFDDLRRLLFEIRDPTFVSRDLFSELVTPLHSELGGILPGWGYYPHNTFGIGFEIKGDKNPHWMGPASDKSYGHFGQSGTFIFHDPVELISIACVTNVSFGPWAKEVYPLLCHNIYTQYATK